VKYGNFGIVFCMGWIHTAKLKEDGGCWAESEHKKVVAVEVVRVVMDEG